jgi:hypothetical protein
MIRFNRKQQRQPIGGHHFPEPGLMIKGETFDEVVKKLRTFRLDNGIKLGDPERDVLVYYASKFPYMVEEYWPERVEQEADNDFLRYAHWLRTTWQNPPKSLVTKLEANDRAEKCRACPHNVKNRWKDGLEQQDLLRRSFMLRYGQNSPEYLGFCSCHRADLSVFVYLADPKSFSVKEKTTEQPSGCWVKSLDSSK